MMKTISIVSLFFLNLTYAQNNSNPQSILFVGDSITAGVNSSYSYLIKNECHDKKVEVLAKPSMQTSWMVDNLLKKLIQNHFDRVYIYGGINDIFSGVSIESAISNVQRMVNTTLANGGEPVVLIGYNAENFMDSNKFKPTKYIPTKEEFEKIKNKYIAYQTKLKQTLRNAKIIDQIELSSTLSSDAIHPNAAGHKIIKNIVMDKSNLKCNQINETHIDSESRIKTVVPTSKKMNQFPLKNSLPENSIK